MAPAANATMLAPAMLPEYACAILEDASRWLLLDLRPADARFAAGQLTCFGGRCEAGEDDLAAVRRELAEELGWHPPSFRPAAELWRGPRFIARFWRGDLDRPCASLRTEPGHRAILAPWPALAGLPLSPWHARVLAAVRAGQARVDLP